MRIPPTEKLFKLSSRTGKGNKVCDIFIGEQWVLLSIILRQKFTNGLGNRFRIASGPSDKAKPL
jgi:hypothetical protein